MLYLEMNRPAVARDARWYLEPVDYLSMRLTGTAAASPASMTAAWLTDNRHVGRVAYDADLIRMAGITGSKLPPLRPTGSVVGTVRDDVAADLGLGPGVAVVAGTPDLHSAAAGTGTLESFQCHMAISTTSWISCPVPFKKTDPIRQVASVPGILPDQYLVANNHETAGACLQWLRDQVIAPDDVLSCLTRPGFAELIELAATASPGCGGVLFTPWLAGERSPIDDRNARAGFHNLSLETSRAVIVRAVLEGVACNNRWLHQAVEHFVKRRLEPIRLFGGGAQSDLWCQIHADVMDRTIERLADPISRQSPGRRDPGRHDLGRHRPIRGRRSRADRRDLPARPIQQGTLRPAIRRVPQVVQIAEGDVQAPQPRSCQPSSRSGTVISERPPRMICASQQAAWPGVTPAAPGSSAGKGLRLPYHR
jgi:xylulokinase